MIAIYNLKSEIKFTVLIWKTVWPKINTFSGVFNSKIISILHYSKIMKLYHFDENVYFHFALMHKKRRNGSIQICRRFSWRAYEISRRAAKQNASKNSGEPRESSGRSSRPRTRGRARVNSGGGSFLWTRGNSRASCGHGNHRYWGFHFVLPHYFSTPFVAPPPPSLPSRQNCSFESRADGELCAGALLFMREDTECCPSAVCASANSRALTRDDSDDFQTFWRKKCWLALCIRKMRPPYFLGEFLSVDRKNLFSKICMPIV